MIAMTLAQVAQAIGVTAPAGADQVTVTSVEFDTRRITPGALFVALHGENVDGHDYAAAAAAAGAVAVLGTSPIEADLPMLVVRTSPISLPRFDVPGTAEIRTRTSWRRWPRWPMPRSPRWSATTGSRSSG